MDTLKGTTMLIGREPGTSRLMVAVCVGGKWKSDVMGQAGTVPGSVSRCRPSDKIAHCSIAVDQSGDMTVKNLKQQNVTYVDGTAVASKRITPGSRVALGRDRYEVSVSAVLKTAAGLLASMPPQPREYSISHLEKVWDGYHSSVLAVRKRQNFVGIMGSVPMMFTFGSGAISGVAKALEWPEWVFYFTLSLTIIGFVLMIYGFWLRVRFNGGIDQLSKLSEDLQKKYVCPNPQCRRFLGNQPYSLLKQNKSCPYCHCKWTEDKK